MCSCTSTLWCPVPNGTSCLCVLAGTGTGTGTATGTGTGTGFTIGGGTNFFTFSWCLWTGLCGKIGNIGGGIGGRIGLCSIGVWWTGRWIFGIVGRIGLWYAGTNSLACIPWWSA